MVKFVYPKDSGEKVPMAEYSTVELPEDLHVL